MWFKILIAVVVLIVVLVAVIALQSADFRITRSATIAAPPAVVFAQVNDFNKWVNWSPWEKLDPNLKRKHEGAPAGVGAIYSWEGNKQVGSGRMTIQESKPGELLRIQLEFLAPFKATNVAEFAFKPEGSQTAITWTMTGKKNFMSKAFGLVMNMDKLVGGDFEKGLANLKAVAEAAPKQ